MSKTYWTAEIRDDVWELISLQTAVKNFKIETKSNYNSFFTPPNMPTYMSFGGIEVSLTLDYSLAQNWLNSLESDFSTTAIREKTLVLKEYESNICQNIVYFENYLLVNLSTLSSDYTTNDLILEMTIQSDEAKTVKPNWMERV